MSKEYMIRMIEEILRGADEVTVRRIYYFIKGFVKK